MKLRALLLAVGAIALLPVAQAGAGGATDFTLKSAREKHGNYSDFNRIHLAVGDTKTVWFEAKTKLDHDQKVSFSDLGIDYHGYKVTWLRHGDEDATAEVTSADGLRFNLEPGQPKHFAAVITRKPASDAELCVAAAVKRGAQYDYAYVGVNEACVL